MQSFPLEPAPEPAPPEPKPQPLAGFLRFVWDVLQTFLLAALLYIGINAISARIRVDGFSMEPTLHSQELVIVNKLAYQLGKPQIGDVIVFHYPRDPEQEYIKRVVGLPGDSVQVQGGVVWVNGRALDEPYIAAQPLYDIETTVPEDALFVLGDNRNNSSDSHNWGPVPMENVIGKAIVVYWPPDAWGVIPHTRAIPAAASTQP